MKIKSKNILLIITTLLVFILMTTIAVIASYQIGFKQANIKSKELSQTVIRSTTTPTPTSIPTLTPTPLVPTNTPIPAPKNPSARALKAAALGLASMNEEQKQSTINNYSSTGDVVEATRNLAYYLDNNPERLALVEATLEKAYQNTYNPPPLAPVIDFPKHCTSSTYGNSTYTNCY